MNKSFDKLQSIFQKIDLRVVSILKRNHSWPCKKGCDSCCTRLGQALEISQTEWRYLEMGINQLPPATRKTVLADIESMSRSAEGFYCCPLLDKVQGACRVYQYRPAACRSFGFYASRIGNRWCQILQEISDRGEFQDVILGNQDAVEEDIRRHFGPNISIAKHSQNRFTNNT